MPPPAAAGPFADRAADPFAASRNSFDALAVELGAADAARLGHAELEELLDLRGRELLRQLYQDHLELRRLRESWRSLPTPYRCRSPAPTVSPAVRSRPVTPGCWPPSLGW